MSVALWSVISAAFIGPGTVTTAASAGAGFGFRLMWALVFSTLACLTLQEASARLTVISGRDLGEALSARYSSGFRRAVLLLLVCGAIIVGCAAYEAGNILGGVAGAALGTDIDPRVLTVLCGVAAAALLALGTPRAVALALSCVVGVMGAVFLLTAILLEPDPGALLSGAILPSFPPGSGVVILGLVGTTVVPYNLFLGSRLARGQSLAEIRFGLSVSVVMGGIISMGVLAVGTTLNGELTFPGLASVLNGRLGSWAGSLFGWGLFAAGFSSAVTAPLAAALTAAGIFGGRDDDAASRWGSGSWRFRSVWGGVLAVGMAFGLAGVKPIPAIILAQALNGLLLPAAAVFLFWAVNDTEIMGSRAVNGLLSNALMGGVVAVSVLLGAAMLLRVGAGLVGATGFLDHGALPALAAGVALVVTAPLVIGVLRRRWAGPEASAEVDQ